MKFVRLFNADDVEASSLRPALTLGVIRDRLQAMIDDGASLDSPMVGRYHTIGFMVGEDLTKVDDEDLRARVTSLNDDAAYEELERRALASLRKLRERP